MNHTYTVVEEEDGIIVCDDCGAYTTMGHELMIKHHPICVPGEAKRWEKYYSECEEADDRSSDGR